jgi:hypothetical protein
MNGVRKRVALVAGLTLVGLGLAVWAGIGRPEAAQGQAEGDSGTPSGITVTGTGTVKAKPDQAEFSFGVETQGATADEALAKNNAAVQKVIDAIKAAGVAASDIQTQQVSVSPRYSDDGQAIVGYTAINTVTAKIRDLSKAGAVVDAAVKAGANQVYGPTLSISDQSGFYADALEKAYADAKSKAQTIASAAGVSVGKVVNIVEGGGFGPVPYASAEEAAGGVPIEPGLQDVQASLTVTFAIS